MSEVVSHFVPSWYLIGFLRQTGISARVETRPQRVSLSHTRTLFLHAILSYSVCFVCQVEAPIVRIREPPYVAIGVLLPGQGFRFIRQSPMKAYLGFPGQTKVYHRNQVNQPRMPRSDWSTHHRTSSWPPFQTMYLTAATQLDESRLASLAGLFIPTDTHEARPNTKHSYDARADILFRPFQIGTHRTFLSLLCPTKTTTHWQGGDRQTAERLSMTGSTAAVCDAH